MANFIREIPSDSTITNIEIISNSIAIAFQFDITINNQNSGTLIFEEMAAFRLLPGWNDNTSIEGIAIKKTSEFLEDTKKIIQKEAFNKNLLLLKLLNSYQILNCNNVVIEVVAISYKMIK